MNILMISPECAPFSKVGGLADMVSALSKQLAAAGHDVKIFTPLHSSVRRAGAFETALDFMSVHMGLGIEEFCKVWKAPLGKAAVYFAEFNKYFERSGVYDGSDNEYRFAFMCKAAIDFCAAIKWTPDVIHCHDWTAGLVPVYLNTTHMHTPLGRAATVFTIHNMQHQGVFSPKVLDYAGLPAAQVYKPDNLESFGSLNMLKGAIYNSTKLSTVSPTYSKEIQTPAYGCGLDGILRFKSADLVGILNGVDLEEWNPASDSLLPANYDFTDLSGKAACKKALQKKLGLELDDTLPVFGVVARLFDQKGLDLLAHIMQPLLQNMRIQFALLGSGEKWLEDAFKNIAKVNPSKSAAYIGYNNELSHLIEAGSDFFVMPSRFEPCGLNQMYSMLYGTLPIVRNTGGLADTVTQYDERARLGDGFKFEDATCEALYNTIGWACATWYDRPEDISMLRRNAMHKDFSWKSSAKEYEKLYRWAVSERAKAF